MAFNIMMCCRVNEKDRHSKWPDFLQVSYCRASQKGWNEVVFCVNTITTSTVGRVEHPNNDFQVLIGISQNRANVWITDWRYWDEELTRRYFTQRIWYPLSHKFSCAPLTPPPAQVINDCQFSFAKLESSWKVGEEKRDLMSINFKICGIHRNIFRFVFDNSSYIKKQEIPFNWFRIFEIERSNFVESTNWSTF